MLKHVSSFSGLIFINQIHMCFCLWTPKDAQQSAGPQFFQSEWLLYIFHSFSPLNVKKQQNAREWPWLFQPGPQMWSAAPFLFFGGLVGQEHIVERVQVAHFLSKVQRRVHRFQPTLVQRFVGPWKGAKPNKADPWGLVYLPIHG